MSSKSHKNKVSFRPHDIAFDSNANQSKHSIHNTKAGCESAWSWLKTLEQHFHFIFRNAQVLKAPRFHIRTVSNHVQNKPKAWDCEWKIQPPFGMCLTTLLQVSEGHTSFCDFVKLVSLLCMPFFHSAHLKNVAKCRENAWDLCLNTRHPSWIVPSTQWPNPASKGAHNISITESRNTWDWSKTKLPSFVKKSLPHISRGLLRRKASWHCCSGGSNDWLLEGFNNEAGWALCHHFPWQCPHRQAPSTT